MDKELLKRYFEKQCSATEIKTVEDWILDPDNRTEFDAFLSGRWDDHVNEQLGLEVAGLKRHSVSKWWAVAAATAAIAFGLYLYRTQPAALKTEIRLSAVPDLKKAAGQPTSSPDTNRSMFNTKKNIQYERKAITNQSDQVLLTQADTVKPETRPKFVKATKLQDFMVNKVALLKLIGDIDSNQVVLLNLDVHDITFQRLAVLLRDECGIVLEPCNGSGMAKTYTARFEKISLPDLLNDMSQKMMFSYSVQDNKVKICFN
uniref:hypothetical protein n=1 Tax=Pedobacter schmidteae TaxID=2201271 RepID=UPI000EADC54C|nr:hypothetical protein [Pedobacter schmidteae]